MGEKLKTEKEFLLIRGPLSRWNELKNALEVAAEFIKGFRRLHFIGPCVTVFGSARFKEDHVYYQQAREYGKRLAEKGFTIMTGGGPGIMEAANRGAKDINGRSVGCNVVLPKEQLPNPYLDVMIEMNHFYVRKVMLLKYSYAFVVMPGGFGTMDELFETLTLIQTRKINRFPVVLVGKDFWSGMLAQIEQFKNEGTISTTDDELFFLTDSIEDGLAHINTELKEKFGSSTIQHTDYGRWWLFENFAKRLHWRRTFTINLD